MTPVRKDGNVYKLDRNGKLFIANREALVLGAYWDGKHMSIGMGSNDPTLKAGDTITISEAFERFEDDIIPREKQLSKRITREPTQEQYNALFSCFYQSGWRNVPELIDMHNGGIDPKIIGEAFSDFKRCTNQAGTFLRGLETRRKLEGHLYATGEYEEGLEVVDFFPGDPRDKATRRGTYTVTLEDLPE